MTPNYFGKVLTKGNKYYITKQFRGLMNISVLQKYRNSQIDVRKGLLKENGKKKIWWIFSRPCHS